MKKPKPHQAAAIASALVHFRNNSRGKLIMPCGSGKTLTALWIADVVKARSVVICLPNLVIEGQAVETWLTEMHEAGDERFKVLVLGSDTSISKRFEVVNTTAQSEVDRFIKTHENSEYVIFTTYHSAHLLFGKSFDFAIFDEAHRTVPSNNLLYYKRQDDSTFSSLLYDSNVKIAKRLFMTATEKNIRSEAEGAVSMDNTDLYGEVVYQLTMKDAIERAILSDYKIVTLFTTDGEVRDAMRVQGLVNYAGKDLDFGLFKTALCLLKSIEIGYTQKALTFHSSVQKAENFAHIFRVLCQEMGLAYYADSISGADNPTQKSDKIKGLSVCEIGVLSNAQLLKEGFDLPEIDTVVFSDYKSSVIDIVQIVGRALRLKKDGRLGYVLIPCLIEQTQDFLTSGELANFQKIVNVLSLQDERIFYEFRLVHEKGRNQKIIEFKATDLQKIDALNVDVQALYSKVEVYTFESLSKLNFLGYKEAKELIQEKYPNIKNREQYKEVVTNNELSYLLPKHPEYYYANRGWTSWMDFLGKFDTKLYWSYEQAKRWVQDNLLRYGIDSIGKWKKYIDGEIAKDTPKPLYIPDDIRQYYRGRGWVSTDDFFARKGAVDYDVCKRYLRRYYPHITDSTIFHKHHTSQKPLHTRIALHPDRYYEARQEWISWSDFLNRLENNQYELFKHIIERYVLPLYDITRPPYSYYRTLIKNAKNGRIAGYKMPVAPEIFFGEAFEGYYKLFGVKEFLSYQETKEYYAQFQISSSKKFREFIPTIDTPFNVPRQPDKFFAKTGEWVSWEDFLGYSK